MKIAFGIIAMLVATSANAQFYHNQYQPIGSIMPEQQPVQQVPIYQPPAPNPQNYMPVYQQPRFQVQPNTNAPGYLPGQWEYQRQQAILNATLCQQGNASYC